MHMRSSASDMTSSNSTIPFPLAPVRATQRARWLQAVVLALLAIAAVWSGFRTARMAQQGELRDFAVHYQAGQDLRSGHWLYNLEHGYEGTYKSAPGFAVLLAPLSWLTPTAARVVWYVVDLGFLVAMFVISARILYPDGLRTSRARWLALVTAVLMYRFATNQLHQGQPTTMWVALAMIGFWALLRGRPGWSGFSWGAAVCVKVVPLCFVPYLLLRRRYWIGFATFAAAVGLLFVATVACCGWETSFELWRDWPRHLKDSSIPELATDLANQSVCGVLMRLLTRSPMGGNLLALKPSQVALMFTVLNVATGLALYLFIARSWRTGGANRRSETHLALLLLFMTAFNPLGWVHNAIALVFPCFLLVEMALQMPSARPMLLRALVVSQLLNWIPQHTPWFPALDWLPVYGARLWSIGLLTAAVLYGYRQANRAEELSAADDDAEIAANTLPFPPTRHDADQSSGFRQTRPAGRRLAA